MACVWSTPLPANCCGGSTSRLGTFTVTDLVSAVAARCTEVESGARNVDNILTNTLLPEVSMQLLGMMASGEKVSKINVSIGEDGKFAYSF